MRTTLLALPLLFLGGFRIDAQEKAATPSAVDSVLKSIDHFRNRESKRDSTLGHVLGSHLETDFARRHNFYDSVLIVINRINYSSLSQTDQINLDLVRYDVEDEVASYKFRSYLNPILSDEGFHTGLPSMGAQVLATRKDIEHYMGRLKDIPRYVNEHLALMRTGLALGISQPRSILDGYANTYDQHIVSDVEKSVFFKPFFKKPAAIPANDWQLMTAAAKTAIHDSVITAFVRIRNFFNDEYLPRTRKTIGVSNFPDGLAYYQERVHHYTTTDMTYEEVYQRGLAEVARIKAEMEKVIKQTGFKGNMAGLIKFLRTDPKFYATTPEQLLKEASFIAKKADGLLPQYFGKLPRQPYGVEPVPAHLAPTYTAGRYSGAPLNSRRAGNYWVNTYDLKSRPLYALEALTLHEAVPGHHLQIALTKELDNLPAFRRGLYVNAFGEGWGLYSEYLGEEMGFYKDPYSYFGRLTYEMWRACRLVLDVALHTKGWTRQQGVDYLSSHTALSMHEVNTEINRYISWPGQALAYKTGELKMKELRRKAEEKLGEAFDIREFHDMMLSQGTVTLKILEGMVDRFIEEKKIKQ